MTDEKKVSGKLTEQQLELGLEKLEKRSATQRGEPPVRRNTARSAKKAASKPPQQAVTSPPTEQVQPAVSENANSAPKRSTKAAQKTASKAAAQKTAAQVQTKATQKASGTGKQKGAANATTAVKNEQPAKTGKSTKSRQQKGKQPSKTPVRIIPLGGLNEVGKNMTLIECKDDMFMIDCGMTFPDEQMLGVDLVLPDFSYVVKNRERLRGIVITHGHEDHIGTLPFFLKQVNVPVYATKLTIGLIENKLREHGLYGKVKLIQVAAGGRFKLGCMEIEFIRVNHSIPDAVALAIQTPVGVLVHTGDFKIDYTPIVGGIIDLARFGELGSQGVLALFSDSTNAERPGFTPTEKTVSESFDKLFKQAKNKRVIVATFSSNVYRIQLICEAAAKVGRKVAVSGRSMVNVVATATELGYLTPPPNVMIDIDDIHRYPPEEITIITTGSQGEPMSALSRMAGGDHRKVSIGPGDCIIISATPIPGNEKTVGKVINELMRLGADVIWERMYEVHVSGHACQEELKIMLALTKPQFFFPVHGEYKQLKRHAALAIAMGIDPGHVLIGENGRVFELDGVSVKMDETVPSGRLLVDGLGVGDVGSIVLRDRQHLGQDGLIVVVMTIDAETGEILAGPDIISRGFVYVREAEEMLTEAREIARKALGDSGKNKVREWMELKTQVRDALSSFFYSRTKRSPMILPVIQEV